MYVIGAEIPLWAVGLWSGAHSSEVRDESVRHVQYGPLVECADGHERGFYGSVLY